MGVEEIETSGSDDERIARFLKKGIGEKVAMVLKNVTAHVEGGGNPKGFVGYDRLIVTNKRIFALTSGYDAKPFIRQRVRDNRGNDYLYSYPSEMVFKSDFVFDMIKERTTQLVESNENLDKYYKEWDSKGIGGKLGMMFNPKAAAAKAGIVDKRAGMSYNEQVATVKEGSMKAPAQWFDLTKVNVNKKHGLLSGEQLYVELEAYLSSLAQWFTYDWKARQWLSNAPKTLKEVQDAQLAGDPYTISLYSEGSTDKLYNFFKKNI